MLHLVGLGLDDGEVTQKGLDALRNADKVFAEFYTNTETVSLERLEEQTDTSIEVLSREQVEQKDKVLESAKKKETVFLVSGHPLTATTHYDIKHRANKEGINVNVVHAPSIITSVAETGLNVYKFGRTVTLPENAEPDSVLEHIEKNDSIGLHTLVLLDINYSASDAAAKLVAMNKDLGEREALVVQRANSETQKVSVSSLSDFSQKNLGETPHCIVIVGETSHKEEEFLESHQ